MSQFQFPPGKFWINAPLRIRAARVGGVFILLAFLLSLAGGSAILVKADAGRNAYNDCADMAGQISTSITPSDCYTNFITQAPNLPVLIQPADGATGVSTSPTLEVMVSDPEEHPLDVSFYGRPAATNGEDFTLIALPDTQNESTDYPEIFSAQTQWIADNKISENIAFATHLGDIVNIATSTTEWGRADAAMDLLDLPNVFYSVGPGNHDMGPGSLYETYFGVIRFSGKSWYGGHYGSDNYNNYSLFSASGMDFILINLEYLPTTEMLNWADARLKEYSDRRGIVVSHNILNLDDTWSNWLLYNALKDNPNLFLMLCGHMHADNDGAAYRAALGDDGHTIHVMLADYQDFPNGGNGYLRVLRFSPADDMIYATTYSPYDGSSITTYPDQMEMSYEMASGADFELIGTVSGVASVSHASLTWPDLDLDTEYEWYVEVSNGEETTSSPTWGFTTQAVVSTYDLTIAADPAGGGTTNPVAGVHTYTEGSAVSITATPYTGYTFDHWSGACMGSGTCQVTMDANKAVTAHFTRITYTLTAAVNPAGAGTTNPSVGTHTYIEGTVVPISAISAAGYAFDHWAGGVADPNSASTTVIMDGDKTVTAYFSEITYELTIAVEPIEGGATNPVVGVHTYVEDSMVSVTAAPAAGYAFDHWSGACMGSDACQVTMDGDKAVTAHFIGITYDLTISVDPVGGGITTPAAGTYTFAENVVVPLAATPAAGYTFAYWSSVVEDPNSASTTVTMDGDKSITAYFTLNSYLLSINKVGSGTGIVTSDPDGIDCGAACSYSYDHGTAVTLYAQAAPGSTFSGWSGAGCSGTDPCTLTIDGSKAVTATFEVSAPPCYSLEISHAGQGSDPVADPANSTDCPAGQYIAGEIIHLSDAIPDSGWRISGWAGTSQDASLADGNFLSMPASDHAASVIYKTLVHIPIVYGMAATIEP